MALRWQRFGVRSHALDGERQPVAGEGLRALCVGVAWPSPTGDVQPYDPTPWGLPCGDCVEVWDDMDGEQ